MLISGKKILINYWDKQLAQLIHYGFLLSFDNKVQLKVSTLNHSSAKDFPEDINIYLKEEKSFDAILGPFENPPIPGLHVFPFLTHDKNGATSHRVIVHLSYQHGASVNAGVDPDICISALNFY